MQKKLYCFDFDGTLTKKDTMFAFLKFYEPKKFYISFIKHIPLFIMLKLKLANAGEVKKSFVNSILKGKTRQEIESKALQFFNENYPSIIRESAIDFINQIDRTTTKCLLVTASLDIWAKPFAEKWKMDLVATQAHFENDIFTGKFSTKNCNGQEKVNRIKKLIEKETFDKIIAFGDTSGDQEMLSWADEGFYRFFH